MRGRLPFVGTYTGTGAALASPDIGFRPKAVLITNETDGTFAGFAIDGQADLGGQKSVDSGVGTTDLSNATAGITFGSRGFTVGTDAGFNTNAKVYRFVAW